MILFIIVVLLINRFLNKLEKNVIKAKEPIIINLLTSVHPSLSWNFQALDQKIIVKPGEVRTIEYIVENLKDKKPLVLQHLHISQINFSTPARRRVAVSGNAVSHRF